MSEPAYGAHRAAVESQTPIRDLVRQCLADTQTPYGSSRESEARRCQEAHRLRYVEGIVPNYQKTPDPDDERDAAPEYFGLGQVVHAGLRMLHAYGLHPCEVTEYLMQADTDTDLGIVVEAERLLLSYCGHWDVLPVRGMIGWEGCKVRDVEVYVEDATSFATPLTRRLDLVLLVGPHKRLTIVDHKTRGTSLPDGRTRKQQTRAEFAHALSRSPAALGQVWAAIKHYGPAAGVSIDNPPDMIFNYIIKLKKIPKFERVLVEFDPAVIRRWRDIRAAEADQSWQISIGRLPVIPNWDACWPMMGSPCRYVKWCHGSDEQRQIHYTKEETA